MHIDINNIFSITKYYNSVDVIVNDFFIGIVSFLRIWIKYCCITMSFTPLFVLSKTILK